MDEIKINFAPHQKLPPGYEILYSEVVEKYFFRTSHVDGLIWATRWGAYRNAWAHYRKSQNQ